MCIMQDLMIYCKIPILYGKRTSLFSLAMHFQISIYHLIIHHRKVTHPSVTKKVSIVITQNIGTQQHILSFLTYETEVGKKNNQTSVSDADREIPILGSTENAGNSVNLVSGIIRSPSS